MAQYILSWTLAIRHARPICHLLENLTEGVANWGGVPVCMKEPVMKEPVGQM